MLTVVSDRIDTADTLAAQSGNATASYDSIAPRLAQRYELLGLLGTGGMGAVYRVRDTELGEIVALKMLRPELMNDDSALARFRDEVRLARRVTHRNVARTFDIGEHEGAKFLTMELVDGRSLAARIAEQGPLPSAEVIEIAEAICAGLHAAHAAGVVHRDLKPENVLIANDARVVVTDFGIAHAHDGGRASTAIVGTPAYMAPEQLEQHATVDHRADIYALGAVIYELLTGERAWNQDTPMQVLSARLASRTPPDPRRVRPSVSEQLAAVVMRCMANGASERYGDAMDVARAIRSAEVTTSPTPGARPAPLPAASAKTVAVLPFRNDGLPEDEYIADGLTDDLIDTLSMTRGLLVRPRGVVARFKGQSLSARAVGQELGVQVVVEGSLRRVGNMIRIGVRAIGTADDFQLWARRFDAPLNDVLLVSDQAAQAIAEALTTELPSLERAAPNDPAAVELYLRARHMYWSAWSSTAEPAVQLFERALALAPNDAKIVASCAIANGRMLFFGEGSHEAVAERTRELTERAVVLAPELGDAWAARASYHLNTGDAVEAARVLRTGLAHAPNSAMLQDWLGRLLLEAAAFDEAIARLRVAVQLDPTLLSARLELARGHALRGEFQAAEALLEPAEGTMPVDSARARFALWGGIRHHTQPTQPYARLSYQVLEGLPLSAEDRAFMAKRPRAASVRLRPLFYQRNAEIHAFLGEIDAAMEAVEGAVDNQLIDYGWLKHCPVLAPLRSDPRWPPLAAKVEERAQKILAALTA
jgi:eukaryotic-like serine/threonine-protein kinase